MSKGWIIAAVALCLAFWSSLASALPVTITIHEIQLVDPDHNQTSTHQEHYLVTTARIGNTNFPVGNVPQVTACFPPPGDPQKPCHNFIIPPAGTWSFTADVAPTATSIDARIQVRNGDASRLDPIDMSPGNPAMGDRGLHLRLNPQSGTWTLFSDPSAGLNPTVAQSSLIGPGDIAPIDTSHLTARVTFSVDLCNPAAAEVCDGVDNDCDQLIDTADPNFVAPPAVSCPGSVPNCTFPQPQACVNGKVMSSCPAPDPTETVCNGVDDNCNQQVDEGAANLPEVCDGADNDCDDLVDSADPDLVVPTFTCAGIGADCTFTLPASCINGGIVNGSCPMPDASETACNGLDDDCNGRVDEGFQNQRYSVVEPGTCYTSTTYCEAGVVLTTPRIYGDGSPEVPDGINNDCADDQIDECAPGQTDWWCTCSGGDVAFAVDRLDDPFVTPDPNDPSGPGLPDANAAAAACLPTSQPATGTCSVRGVFRRAEQLDYLGCRVVATLPAGTIVSTAEQRLSEGSLLLRGAGSDPSQETCGPNDPLPCIPASTALTRANPCTEDALISAGVRDCRCATTQPFHRLINALTAQSPDANPPGVEPSTAALSLSLELEDLILRGGTVDLSATAFARPDTAGGAVVVEKGEFAARNVLARDNRTRGLGAAIAVFDSPYVVIEDSVVTDNMNAQPGVTYDQVGSLGKVCYYNGISGGFTGFGGGIYLQGVEDATIERSAITENSAPDGAGIAAADTSLVVRNSTIAGNRAGGAGGGMYFRNGNVSLLFNTIARNHSTLSGQSATECAARGGAIYGIGRTGFSAATLTAFGNLIAENSAVMAELQGLNPDCMFEVANPLCGNPVVVSGAGYNFVGDSRPGCGTLPTAVGTLSGDPELTLTDDDSVPVGGTSAQLVYPLAVPGSSAYQAYPAVPAAPAPPCLTASASTDQRGALRPTNAPCSIGAWESSTTFAQFRASGLVAGLFASETLTIKDRARVLSPLEAGSFTVGFNASLSGDVRAESDGFLSNGATVRGNVTIGGSLGGNTQGVSGTVVGGASLSLGELLLRPGTSSGAGVTVPHDGIAHLPPGSYGHVVVRSRATLDLLSAGVYRFKSLTFEPDGTLTLAGNFDVALAVDGTLLLGDRFKMRVNGQTTLDSDHLFLYSRGPLVTYGHDSAIVGDLEAPLALVEVKDRSFVRGAIGGRSVTIGFDAVVGPRAAR
jgi:hypothetical protein